jgi:hypothetical protein
MERYDRRARVLILWVAVICLSFLAFAIGVWCGEQTVPECTVGEPEIVMVPEAEAPQDDRADNPSVTCGDSSLCTREPYADPMCEDSYLMEDHPLPMDLQVMLYGACLEFGVDWELALALIEQESQFRNVMGDDGESAGYMQVQEKWHKERMALLGVNDLKDPEGNFRVGCHFLRECIDKYGLEKGLGYYNSGKAQVTEYSLQVLERMS